MIPPVFITLTVNDYPHRFNVATISSYFRRSRGTATILVTLEPITKEDVGFYSVAETPEEIDELIRRTTEPYTVGIQELFHTAIRYNHNNF